MKLTKNLVTREEAEQLSPDYVKFTEKGMFASPKVLDPFCYPCSFKRGQSMLTCHDGQYVRVKVSSLKDSPHGDGPVVRVSNGEYSWRIDGNAFGAIIPEVSH